MVQSGVKQNWQFIMTTKIFINSLKENHFRGKVVLWYCILQGHHFLVLYAFYESQWCFARLVNISFLLTSSKYFCFWPIYLSPAVIFPYCLVLLGGFLAKKARISLVKLNSGQWQCKVKVIDIGQRPKLLWQSGTLCQFCHNSPLHHIIWPKDLILL